MKNSTNSPRQLDNIGVIADSTDHFHFICPDCGVIMQVKKVLESDTPDTYFILKCNVCGGEGHRKINWNACHKLSDL